MARINPIKKVNVGEQVFEQMKQLLIQGEWKPGDKLPSENELSDMFGVSRITVRQVLQKLATLGLLETKVGEGTFVKQVEVEQELNELIPLMYLGDKTKEQVMEFREIMDAEGAKLATKRATEKDLEMLDHLITRMEDAAQRHSFMDFVNADFEFHIQIGKTTRNPLIIKTNGILRDILQNTIRNVIEQRGYESGIYYHKKILKAMGERDSDRAMNLMRDHIRNTPYDSFY